MKSPGGKPDANRFSNSSITMRVVVSLFLALLFSCWIPANAQTFNSLNSVPFPNPEKIPINSSTPCKGYPQILNFIPGLGHFCSGQTGKGITDIWNVASLLWYSIEQTNAIRTTRDKMNHNFPYSRAYTHKNRNIDILQKQYAIGLYSMVALSYINSVVDSYISNSRDNEMGIFLGGQGASFDSFVPLKAGYSPATFQVIKPHIGLSFGYRSIFEYYAKMTLPLPGNILYYATHVDWVLPLSLPANLEIFTGLGLVVFGFGKDPDTMWGSGLGSHLRLGSVYRLGNHHYFWLTLAPYMIWNELFTQDNPRFANDEYDDNHRFSARPLGKSYGISFTYKCFFRKRLYFESYIEYAKIAEPAGEYIEYDRQNNDAEIHIQRPEQSSQIVRLDLSFNYKFQR